MRGCNGKRDRALHQQTESSNNRVPQPAPLINIHVYATFQFQIFTSISSLVIGSVYKGDMGKTRTHYEHQSPTAILTNSKVKVITNANTDRKNMLRYANHDTFCWAIVSTITRNRVTGSQGTVVSNRTFSTTICWAKTSSIRIICISTRCRRRSISEAVITCVCIWLGI